MPIIKKLELFPELSRSLCYFTEELADSAIKNKVNDIYFLSREGQPLKKIFDCYTDKLGLQIKSHYLEVSRRSTLLPSLKALGEEKFDTLFRQYRRVSLLEFLSSLGLEVHVNRFANLLNLPMGSELLREADFPTSEVFRAVMLLPEFMELYELERSKRRHAFINYLTVLSGGTLPEQLVLVDVGWKGTIQDNLHALLCRDSDTPVRSIVGYYIGLIAEGASSSTNTKFGLLFSSAYGHSSNFRTFNENRALFEVILAADHGSIVSYEKGCTGDAVPVYGTFEERDMVFSNVMPVQKYILDECYRLINLIPRSRLKRITAFEDVVCKHNRMVFDATREEREWLSSIYHVENYGVFDRSYFVSAKKEAGLLARICFLLKLVLKRNRGDLGFWPWQTLNERGGRAIAKLYSLIRRWQS